MNRALQQFHEDRELRDAARAVLLADIEHARASISGKGMATRIAGRIGDGARDVFEVARAQADDNRGILAGLIGALLLWLARAPIMEILGIGTDEDAPEEDPEQATAAEQTGATEADPLQGDEDNG